MHILLTPHDPTEEPQSATSPFEPIAKLMAAEHTVQVLQEVFGQHALAAEQQFAQDPGPEYEPPHEGCSVLPRECDWSRRNTRELHSALRHLGEPYTLVKRRSETSYYWHHRKAEAAWFCLTSPTPYYVQLFTVLRPDNQQPVAPHFLAPMGVDLRIETDRVAELLGHVLFPPGEEAIRMELAAETQSP